MAREKHRAPQPASRGEATQRGTGRDPVVKLGLGTVQFGLEYGIANTAGRTAAMEVRAILELAGRAGVRLLDTACAYGASEEVLGECLAAAHRFDIVTKTPAFREPTVTSAHAVELRRVFHESLRRLRHPRVYGLLAHHAADLLVPGGDRLMQVMLGLKREGLVSKVGASVYDAVQIDAILDRHAIDLIQLPVSVLDQRLLASGHLAKLKRAGVEVHARSIFLQGLLLMAPGDVPAYFHPIRDQLAGYHDHARSLRMTPLQLAVGFAFGLPDVDRAVLGVQDTGQLQEILEALTTQVDPRDFARFALADPDMLDPSRWQQLH